MATSVNGFALDTSRPLLTLVDWLNARGGAIVTYEDMAQAHLPSFRKAAAPNGLADDPAAVLRRAASDYEQLGNPGHFAVVEAEPMIHVIGSAGALLDRVISMPSVTGSGLDFLSVLIDALGGPGTLRLGMVPFNVLDQHRGRWQAQQQSSRALLRDFALSVDGILSWAVLYDASAGSCILNLKTSYQRLHG